MTEESIRSEVVQGPETASRKRRVLAVYLNFLFIAAALFLLRHLLQLEDSALLRNLIPLALAIAVTATKFVSPGRFFLSIGSGWVVSPGVKKLESYVTMTLGLLFVLDGSKQLVRWAQFSAAPFYGIIPEGAPYIGLSVLLGSLFIYAGYLIFKLDRRGLYLAGGLMLMHLSSALLSRDAWHLAIARKAVERRELQGLPADPGEIELLQTIMVPAIIGGTLLVLLLLYLSRNRFQLKA